MLLFGDIPNSDTFVGGGANPSAGWAGSDGVDNLWSGEGEHLVTVGGVPHDNLAIGTAGDEPFAIWSEGNGVAAAVVGFKSVEKVDVLGDGPNLDGTIPETDGDNDWSVLVLHWSAADGGSPGAVAFDGEAAVTKDVPKLDGAVAGNGDDAAVAWGEGDIEDIALVVKEELLGGAGGKVPKAEGLIPGGGKKVGGVGGEGNARDEVVVACKAGKFGGPVVVLLWKAPNESGAVAGGGNKEIVLVVNFEGGDGLVVALEGSAFDELAGDGLGGFFLFFDLNFFDWCGHQKKGSTMNDQQLPSATSCCSCHFYLPLLLYSPKSSFKRNHSH